MSDQSESTCVCVWRASKCVFMRDLASPHLLSEPLVSSSYRTHTFRCPPYSPAPTLLHTSPLPQACVPEIEKYCKDIPHGNGRVIRCLQV